MRARVCVVVVIVHWHCSAQLSMFNMEKRYKNKIIIIIIILQFCPTVDALRRQAWPSPVDAHRKLWGPVETLQQTADLVLLTGLKI